MKLLDINLLVFATNEATAQHARARSWFEEIMSGAETVAFPWHVLIGFVRLTTRRAVMDPPLTADRAIDYVQEWLNQPCATTVHPTHRHSAVLRELLNAVGTAGNRVPDAHLAALAIEHVRPSARPTRTLAGFPAWSGWIHCGRDTSVTRSAISLRHVASGTRATPSSRPLTGTQSGKWILGE